MRLFPVSERHNIILDWNILISNYQKSCRNLNFPNRFQDSIRLRWRPCFSHDLGLYFGIYRLSPLSDFLVTKSCRLNFPQNLDLNFVFCLSLTDLSQNHLNHLVNLWLAASPLPEIASIRSSVASAVWLSAYITWPIQYYQFIIKLMQDCK